MTGPRLLIPNLVDVFDAKVERLDGLVRAGKPEVGWRGDDRLVCVKAVLLDRYGRPKIDLRTARQIERIEVWRDCSDTGAHERPWKRIGHWPLDTPDDKVLKDLTWMDTRRPGALTPDEILDREERDTEAERGRQWREAYGPAIEHALALARDKDGLTFHGQAGLGEGKMTRQRRRAQERTTR